MSRAQDRSSGMQTGAEGAGQSAGATSTGMTSGAGATGPATGTTTTGTTTGMAEQSGGQVSGSRHARETEPTTGYRGAPQAYETRGGGGLAVVVRPHFYPTINGYAYAWNGRPWGIILLVLGALLFAAGAAALLGVPMARPVGVGLAVLTGLAGFLWLVYSPVWGIVIVALSVFAIWGLLHDTERSARI
jgi:hypothetical protein